MTGWRAPISLASACAIDTCTLFAPACSLQFALGTYAKVARTPLFHLQDLRVHYLTDENERADGLPDAQVRLYGKSLLYLVSRALDDARKMPLLGLQNAITPELYDGRQWATEQQASVAAWQQLWVPGASGSAQRGFPVTARDVRITRTGATTQATHGSFDNNIDVMTATLERIRGKSLVAPMEWLDY